MNILITGKSGQLGFELQRSLAPLGNITAISRADCDLGDEEALRKLLTNISPQLIANAAAYTAVDKAEADKASAFAVNAQLPSILGEYAKKHNALVIHYSTDYVFDGIGAQPYREDGATNPQSVYGASKLAGEVALSSSGARHLIFRTSWVLSAYGNNFAKTILHLAESKDRLNVVADQWGAPTSASLLADISAHVVRDWQRNPAAIIDGIYHVCSSGETNWCDYARFIVGYMQQRGKELRLRSNAIAAAPSSAYSAPAKRPLNSRLDTNKFKKTFSLNLPSWQSCVEHTLEQIIDNM